MSFTHIVTFKWRDENFAAQPIEDALNALVGTLDGVQSYLCGSDIGLTPSSYDFAVVGTFDSRNSSSSIAITPTTSASSRR